MAKKLRIRNFNKPIIIINRTRNKKETLVYIAVSNKAFKYPHDNSRIVYIGTTKTGTNRVAQSAAIKSKDTLSLYGINQLAFFIVTCGARRNLKSWRKLERALILTFKHMYGIQPLLNTQGKGIKWTDERKYFSRSRLEKVIGKYS